jgi:uncharacterized protein
MVEIECKYIIAPQETMRMELLFSNDPISFFGGVNPASGKVADYRHSNYQQCMTHKAFAFPFGKGSSGAGIIFMEMARLKTVPAAIINIRTDPVILKGPLVSIYFFKQSFPVLNLNEKEYMKLKGMEEIILFTDRDVLQAF